MHVQINNLNKIHLRGQKQADEKGHTSDRGMKQKSQDDDSTEDIAPVLMGNLQTKQGAPKIKVIRILIDSGATHTVLDESLCAKLKIKQTTKTTYTVPGQGKVDANKSCKINMTLP